MSPLLLRRLSDEQLGGRLASGEAAAFDELYRRYIHRLAAYGAHLLGDGPDGDDVAQSALMKAYGALRDGRVPNQVKPWLYRIAHNVAIDLVKRRRELPSDTLPDRAATPAAADAGALVTALAALPDRQRRVYVLRELHGLRIDETASELGLSVPQVEQALFAARNRLAEHLVFGDRLNCVAVQRLAAGPLDLSERRALKTHLRSCGACRSALGVRGRALGSLPLAPFEWLRALPGLLAGGAAPVAAKVGVLVAGATVAAGVPVAVEHTNHRLHRLPPPAAAPARTPQPTAIASVHTGAPAVHAPLVLSLRRSDGAPTATGDHHRHDGGGDRLASRSHDGGGDGSHDGSSPTVTTRTSGGGDGGGGGDAPTATHDGGSSGDGGGQTTTVPAPTITTAPTVTGDGGGMTTTTTTTTVPTTTTSSDGGSHDGGSSGGDGTSDTSGTSSDG